MIAICVLIPYNSTAALAGFTAALARPPVQRPLARNGEYITWGEFRITYVVRCSSGRTSWEVMCPYHSEESDPPTTRCRIVLQSI